MFQNYIKSDRILWNRRIPGFKVVGAFTVTSCPLQRLIVFRPIQPGGQGGLQYLQGKALGGECYSIMYDFHSTWKQTKELVVLNQKPYRRETFFTRTCLLSQNIIKYTARWAQLSVFLPGTFLSQCATVDILFFCM